VSRAVFLDRDGVLVETKVVDGVPRPATSVDELELLPGVAEACARLRERGGFLLIVVTNQPDVARGSLSPEAVEAMHLELAQALPLDDIAVCMHDDADGCDCRKPQPGMILAAARRFDVDLAASFLVGDRWRDVEAAHRAGCRAVFVDRGYAEALTVQPDATVRDLGEAAGWILRQ
jgi:D-glycero-D-manno-heptose 1,7-bisphosphate phosphatase